MELEMTIQEIDAMLPWLTQLSSNGTFTGKVKMQIYHVLKEVKAYYKPFEDARNDVIKKYGEPNEQGGYSVKKEHRIACADELKDMFLEKVKLNITKIRLPVDHEAITPAILLNLDPVMEPDETPMVRPKT